MSGTDKPLPAGQLLAGRYEIRRLLGISGPGRLYAAIDRETDAEVAIQVPLAILVADEAVRARILADAQAAAGLNHPGLVKVHDVQTNGETTFFVSEPPTGRTVRERLDAGGEPMPMDDISRIASSLCATLEYLRQGRRVHSGITPEHITLGDDGGVKLTGFGAGRVAKAAALIPDAAPDRSALYTAPEQLTGDSEVDHRADQYALAAVLYEMVTGEAPAGRVRPASDARSEVSPAFSAALDRALAHDPEDRFPDIASFRAAMFAGKPGRSTRRWLRPVAALLVVAGVLVVTYPSWRGPVGEMLREAARDPKAEAAARAARSDALVLAARWGELVDVLPPDLRPDGATPADDSMSTGNWHLAHMEDDKALESFLLAGTLYRSQIDEATRLYRAEPSRLAAAARALLADLDARELTLRDRVADAARQLDIARRDLAAAPEGDEQTAAQARLITAQAEVDLLQRLKTLAGAAVFAPALRTELTTRLNEADRHLEAARYSEAMESYRQTKAAIEELLPQLDRIEAALRLQAAARQRVDRIRSALGPKALELPDVQATLTAAVEQIGTGDDELDAGRIDDAEALFESATSSLASIIDDAAAELLARARLYADQRNGTAAIVALDELSELDPDNADAARLRADVMSFRVTNSIGMELAFIPPGEFMMGSPSDEVGRDKDERQRRVLVPTGFYMAVTEVTQAQWSAVMDANPSQWVGADLPVERISWDQAEEFCRRLSNIEGQTYRLPTEAEWEYACRAGTPTPFSFGETITPDQANFDSNYAYGRGATAAPRGQPTPVASFPPNAWGLYDMHGNVWEWCPDGYQYDTQSLVTPPPGTEPIEGRVLRGGSWRNRPRFCRSANRVREMEDSALGNIGLRVVLEMP